MMGLKRALEDAERSEPPKKNAKIDGQSLRTDPEWRLCPADRSRDASSSSSGLAFANWVAEGPDGYNHSKAPCTPLSWHIPSYWNSSEGKCTLSPPLLALHQVPSMPIISDPQLFLEIFENRPTPDLAAGRSPPNRRMNCYPKTFQKRCWSGDQRLTTHCLRILSEQFGEDNGQLVSILFDHFKSNANWRELSMIYRIDRYSSCLPSDFKKGEKLWADLWEAEWEVIFQERELFNDSLDAIYSILRWLIAFRYRLLNLFCTNKILEMKTVPGLSREISAYEVTVTKVDADNTLVEKSMVLSDKSFPPFGYLGHNFGRGTSLQSNFSGFSSR